jgi:hypothetical protein
LGWIGSPNVLCVAVAIGERDRDALAGEGGRLARFLAWPEDSNAVEVRFVRTP